MKLHAAALLIIVSMTNVSAQNQDPQLDRGTVSALRKESKLVLVPTLVTTKAGRLGPKSPLDI
jgi:hypothetical protein